MLSLGIWFIFASTLSIQANAVCLDEGCQLSGGLYLKDLKSFLERYADSIPDGIKVLQWNILYDKKKTGMDIWKYRKEHVCQYINDLKPELIGLQEVMESQLKDLKACLPDYIFFGEPREGGQNPLYNPVVVRKSGRFQVVRTGTYWLSLTPNIHGSKSPSSKEPRIASWVQLMTKDKSGKWKKIVLLTTHLAWRSMKTATEQITILLSHLNDVVLSNDKQQPIIITGDLNWGGNSTVYSTMEKFHMHNTMAESLWIHPELTALPPYPGLIDYVWEKGFVSVLSATMMDARPGNGRMLSDHRPVVAVIEM